MKEPGHSHSWIKANPSSNSINHSMSSIWGSLNVWVPPKAWVTSPALPSVTKARAGSTPPVPLFVVIPQYRHLQNARVFCCSWAVLSPTFWALFIVPSLNFLHDLFNTGTSAAIPATPSAMVSPGLSQWQASAALHGFFMPSKPVPPGWLVYCQV